MFVVMTPIVGFEYVLTKIINIRRLRIQCYTRSLRRVLYQLCVLYCPYSIYIYLEDTADKSQLKYYYIVRSVYLCKYYVVVPIIYLSKHVCICIIFYVFVTNMCSYYCESCDSFCKVCKIGLCKIHNLYYNGVNDLVGYIYVSRYIHRTQSNK